MPVPNEPQRDFESPRTSRRAATGLWPKTDFQFSLLRGDIPDPNPIRRLPGPNCEAVVVMFLLSPKDFGARQVKLSSLPWKLGYLRSTRVLGRAEGPNRTFVLPFHTCHLEVSLWWPGIFERVQQCVPLLVAPIRPLHYSGMPQMPAIPIQRVAPQCSTAQKTSPRGFRSIHTGMPTLYLVPAGKVPASANGWRRISPHPRSGSAEKFSSLLPRVRETMRRMIPQGGRAMHEDAVSLLPKTEFTRREFVVTSLAAGFAMAVRPVSAQTITTNTLGLTADEVKIPVESGEIPAYRAMPASGGPFPVVLVVQEIFGVHEHIKDICRRFAKSGHLAVAPELFARQGDVSKMPDINEIISKVVSKVPDAEVMSDLDAVVAWAQKSGKGDTSKLGITGFCWGGRIVWLYAAHNPRLKAGVAWYGRLLGQPSDLQPKNPIDLVASLKAPVLGLYGGSDQGIPVETVEKMRQALQAAGSKSEIILYPDTPHGFHADYRPSYRPEQAKDGWKRLQEWFKKYGAA